MDGPRRSILLVDDDPLIRMAFEQQAKRLSDLQLEAVATVAELRTRIDDGPSVDLVLCDFRLVPGDPAATTLPLIRELVERGLRVVVVSSDPTGAREVLGSMAPVVDKFGTLDELLVSCGF